MKEYFSFEFRLDDNLITVRPTVKEVSAQGGEQVGFVLSATEIDRLHEIVHNDSEWNAL